MQHIYIGGISTPSQVVLSTCIGRLIYPGSVVKQMQSNPIPREGRAALNATLTHDAADKRFCFWVDHCITPTPGCCRNRSNARTCDGEDSSCGNGTESRVDTCTRHHYRSPHPCCWYSIPWNSSVFHPLHLVSGMHIRRKLQLAQTVYNKYAKEVGEISDDLLSFEEWRPESQLKLL